MTTAASAAAILPRVHAALMRRDTRCIWRIADQHTRELWCILAHCDNRVWPKLPWEELPAEQRLKLSIAPNVMINFLRNLAELAANS